MDGANTAVDQGLDRRVGMFGAARVVRIVDHARYTGVDAADGRQKVSDIVILRPVRLGKGQMGRVAVVGERWRVWIDAAKLRLPGMAMTIDKAGHDDRVLRVDDLRTPGIERRSNGSDFLALDQEIAAREITDL